MVDVAPRPPGDLVRLSARFVDDQPDGAVARNAKTS